MLQAEAPFPHPGSTAYLRGTAAAVRIIQRNADHTCTVEVLRPRFLTAEEKIDWAARGASLTRRELAADLYPTEDDAMHCGRKRRLSRRVSRRGAGTRG